MVSIQSLVLIMAPIFFSCPPSSTVIELTPLLNIAVTVYCWCSFQYWWSTFSTGATWCSSWRITWRTCICCHTYLCQLWTSVVWTIETLFWNMEFTLKSFSRNPCLCYFDQHFLKSSLIQFTSALMWHHKLNLGSLVCSISFTFCFLVEVATEIVVMVTVLVVVLEVVGAEAQSSTECVISLDMIICY